jgi:phosphoglycerol transferase
MNTTQKQLAEILGLFLLHSIVPIICILHYGASLAWLMGNVLFGLALQQSLKRRKATARSALLALASVAWAGLNVLLGVSYYMQGSGFNDRFFFHVGLDSLSMGVQAYGPVFLPAVGYIVLAGLSPYLLARVADPNRLVDPGRRVPHVMAGLWLLALVTNYPMYSWLDYHLGRVQDPALPAGQTSAATATQANDTVTEIAANTSVLRKNIILIYAEGVEQLHFDTGIFGELLPGLTRLSAESRRFTNVSQVAGTGWTIAGLVASQCGFPLVTSSHLANNSSMATVENPYADQRCLGDILADSGYRTVYLGGAPLSFAGKGNFLRTHGYQEVFGRSALRERLEDPEYNKGFGLYDDSLFQFALAKLEELEHSAEPYLLTVLTLDAHHPNGRPSKSCTMPPGDRDSMSEAVFCSDQLISRFIGDARALVDPSDTLIVLMSDHLALRNTQWNRLQAHQAQRRLMLMLFDDSEPGQFDRPMTHFDVAPTILQAAGFNGVARLAMGRSAFTDAPGPDDEIHSGTELAGAPKLLITRDSTFETGVMIARQDLMITIGDFQVRATDAGRKIRSGLFLLLLNEQGKVTDTVFTEDSDAMLAELSDRFVIGVSLYGAEDFQGDQYFYGRMSSNPGDLVVRPFDTNVHISPVHISASMQR